MPVFSRNLPLAGAFVRDELQPARLKSLAPLTNCKLPRSGRRPSAFCLGHRDPPFRFWIVYDRKTCPVDDLGRVTATCPKWQIRCSRPPAPGRATSGAQSPSSKLTLPNKPLPAAAGSQPVPLAAAGDPGLIPAVVIADSGTRRSAECSPESA
jgi:hypothetical protein